MPGPSYNPGVPETRIYLLRCRPNGPVKVGVAIDVQARIRSLQTGNPDQLHLITEFPGTPGEEASVHHHLRKERVRGEWFDGEATKAFVAAALENGRDALPDPPAPKPKRSWRMKGEASEITVRKVKPNPVSDEERLANEIEYVNRGLGLPAGWKP